MTEKWLSDGARYVLEHGEPYDELQWCWITMPDFAWLKEEYRGKTLLVSAVSDYKTIPFSLIFELAMLTVWLDRLKGSYADERGSAAEVPRLAGGTGEG